MANKNKTPLLRPLRDTGSTLYVFPSAAEDIGLNINSTTTGVALSNYVLLNFTNNNFSVPGAEPSEPLAKRLAKSLQNYAMNFETALLNETDYSFQEPYTVTENVFWHWMTTHGKTVTGTSGFVLEPATDKDGNTIANVFREHNYRSDAKDRLVQCLGTIDAGNSLSSEFGMYNETYVSVPSSYGNGPVFFRTVSNESNTNFKTGIAYPHTGDTNGGIIQGRKSTDFSYLGDVRGEFDDATAHTYTASQAYEIVTDNLTIQSVLQQMGASTTVSSYDDVNVDFDNTLAGIQDGAYDMSDHCEFKFNAILLYYSVYDLNDTYKQPIATNLFGIVFLDGGTGSGDYTLAPIVKRKSWRGQTAKNAYFGNSYSFRVNIKTLSVYDNTDARIEDNTTTTSVYSQDFNDVISNMNRAIDIMNTNVQATRAIQDNYMRILAEEASLKRQFDDFDKRITRTIGDQVQGMKEALKTELQEYIDEQIADISTGTVSTTETVVYGAGVPQSSDNKRLYVLGRGLDAGHAAENAQVFGTSASANTADRTANQAIADDYARLQDELTALKAEVAELKAAARALKSGSKKKS